MTKLQIPYAYTINKIPVSPEVAEKGQDFSCPICDSEVVLKRGKVRCPHFAHKPDTGCSGEGVRHKVAKQMIYLMYRRSVDTPMISVGVYRRCPNCSQYAISIQGRTGYDDDVKCEVDVGRYRVDIALFRNGKPTYGIEVQDTHPVDDEKWDAFAELGFPCIEVDSKDVIRMWEYDLKSWRQQLPKLSFPMRLDLKAIKHNLHLFNDRIPRIYCQECDDGVDSLEEDASMMEDDASIPEEVRAEILNEMDRQMPGLLARELSSILQFDSKSKSETAHGESAQLKAMEIKNLTPNGITEGLFKLVLQNGRRVKLVCHICHEIDSENPSFLRAKFYDETQTQFDIICPECGFKQENMKVEDCPVSFILVPEE